MIRKLYRLACRLIDAVNNSIQHESISRWHIFAMFVGLGTYLVIFPILHVIVVSAGIELELGNYTNIISAGVSLLTLAEAVRIGRRQNDHQDSVESTLADHSDKLDQIHEHLGIDTPPAPLPPVSNPNYMPGSLGLGWDDMDNESMSTSSADADNQIVEC